MRAQHATASASGPTVGGTLARVEKAGAITPEQHDAWLATYRRARATAARMRSGRSGELRAVVAGVESLARRKLLTSTRMPAAFLQLQRNAEFWPTRSFPQAPQPERKPCTGAAGLGGGRVTFEGDPVVFQWYPGQGLQIQPLANFGKANALWRACQPPTEPPAPGAEPPPPCRPEELRALLDRMRHARLAARWLHGVGVLLRVRRRHGALDQRPRPGHGDPGADARLAAARRREVRRVRPRRARRVRAQAAARRPRALDERRRPPLPHLLVLLRPARAQRLPAVARRPLRLRRRDEGRARASGCSGPATAPPAARSRATTPVRGRCTRPAARSPTSATTGSCATSCSRCATARRPAPTAGARSASTATCTSGRGSASAASARSASAPTPTSASRSRSSPA